MEVVAEVRVLAKEQGSLSNAVDFVVECPEVAVEVGKADFGKDDVLFLLVPLRNDSAVSYTVSSPRFAVESKRRTRRGQVLRVYFYEDGGARNLVMTLS